MEQEKPNTPSAMMRDTDKTPSLVSPLAEPTKQTLAAGVRKFVVKPVQLGDRFKRGDVVSDADLRETGADPDRLLRKGSLRPATDAEALLDHVALDAMDAKSLSLEDRMVAKDNEIALLKAEKDDLERELQMTRKAQAPHGGSAPDASHERTDKLMAAKDEVIRDLQNRLKMAEADEGRPSHKRK